MVTACNSGVLQLPGENLAWCALAVRLHGEIRPWSRAHVLRTPGVFKFVAFGNRTALFDACDPVEIAEGLFRGLAGLWLAVNRTLQADHRYLTSIALRRQTMDRGCETQAHERKLIECCND